MGYDKQVNVGKREGSVNTLLGTEIIKQASQLSILDIWNRNGITVIKSRVL